MQVWGQGNGYCIRFAVGPILLAVAAIVPGLVVRFSGVEVGPPVAALVYGLAVVGAAFLASWAAEIIQLDVSGGLAVALLALIAVLPELAVDFVFTWKSGTDPSQAGNVLANMTGGNQLLLGVGWPLAFLLARLATRRSGSNERGPGRVELAPLQSIEVSMLAVAALAGLTMAWRDRLTLADTAVLIGLYAFYLWRLLGSPATEPELVGPAALVATLPVRHRRLLNGAFFAAAAFTILVIADPFAESLVAVGRMYGVPEFFLVKWLAPLASEAPELLVAGLFALKLQPAISIGVLLSALVNQWTLLVGTLPAVHAIASGSTAGLPLTPGQRQELLITAGLAMVGVGLAARGYLTKEAFVLIVGFYLAQLGHSIYAALVTAGDFSTGRTTLGIGLVTTGALLWIVNRRDLARSLDNGLRRPQRQLAA